MGYVTCRLCYKYIEEWFEGECGHCSTCCDCEYVEALRSGKKTMPSGLAVKITSSSKFVGMIGVISWDEQLTDKAQKWVLFPSGHSSLFERHEYDRLGDYTAESESE